MQYHQYVANSYTNIKDKNEEMGYYTVAFSSKRGSLMPHLSLSSMSPQ